MPRLQSKVSSGDAGKKGDSTQATGHAVGPAPAEGKPTKGNSRAGGGTLSSGAPARPVVLDVPQGVHNIDPRGVRAQVRPWAAAEHPGGGKKTPGPGSSMRERLRKGMD
jgi:hypothetical protein